MKKFILLILVMLAPFFVRSQLNNSWIDYSKTYYKFRLAKDTLCRIYQPVLSSLGLGSVNADHFQLWRNGKQVRLYTSVSNASLGPSDYIEFWGEMNDGLPDNPLFANSDYQLNDKYSLETDTVAYFLTVNTAGGNLRYQETTNGSPGSLVAEPYFMRKADVYYRSTINRGFANIVGEYIYSSSYDMGEGFTTFDFAPFVDKVQTITGLNVYASGPANGVTMRAAIFGNAANNRNVKLKLGNTVVYDAPLNGFNYQRVEVNNLSLSLLTSSNNINLIVRDSSPVSTDRLALASVGITYPARFSFNNQKVFRFDLPASATGNHLLIESFSYGSTPPILYDISEGRRMLGDVTSVPGKIRFVLPASSLPERSFILMNQETGSVNNVQAFAFRNFRDLSLPANRGDYLIISNQRLFDDGSGNNYVEQYRQYRSSQSGGSFNAKVYEIDELTDQFAFGITNHPAAVRDFVRFAASSFIPAPQHLFIIGRGVNYRDVRTNLSNRLMGSLNMVPTFGWPPSDILLASAPGTSLPLISVGRLAAISGDEVSAYLQKVRDYELAQQTSSPLISEKAWMKNFIHVVGGKDSVESEAFRQYMLNYERYAEDTLLGANVNTFTKTSASVVQQASGERIEELFREGLGFIGYFGHSSANTFEFNLGNPEFYDNQGKYPFFNVSGCNAGNFYVFDTLRFTGNQTISEKYVLADQKGSIGFLADTHFGIPPFLNFFNSYLYQLFSGSMYNQPIGKIIRRVDELMGGASTALDFYTRIHLEQINLHGDPVIHLNTAARPDYVIEDPLVKVSPGIITVADNSFSLKVRIMNIGKAVNDSVFLTVKRKLPSDSLRVLFAGKIAPLHFDDSLEFQVPINPLTDKGLNQILVDIDPLDAIDELFESNNSLVKDFYVFEDELRPCFPYNYAIVNSSNITFSASTANPLSGNRQFVMELDTTELFNSAFKKSFTQNGSGGLVEFRPGNLSLTDSTVYYWRVAMIPTGSSNFIWNSSSFVYLPAGGAGFNQSHYYQHLHGTYDRIKLDNDRIFRFRVDPRTLTIRTGLYPYYNYDRINVNLDFNEVEIYGCGYSRIQFYVFDSSTLAPWKNRNVNSTNGLYGSNFVCPRSSASTDSSRAFFEYDYSDPVRRKNAMDFIDSIPAGKYVAISNLGRQFLNTSFINSWKNDTLALGSGKSLYHKLRSIGFSKIDSFYRNIPFLYFFKKGNSSYAPIQVVGIGDSSYIDQSIQLNSINTTGTVTSPVFGPALRWNTLHWRGFTRDARAAADSTAVDVIGIRNDGTEVLLRTVNPARDTTLSFVDAGTYPRLKIRLNSSDSRYSTPHQLRYFRINADYLPEGAVAPNLQFSIADSVQQGQPLDITLAFKNISGVPFDTNMRFRFIVTDRNNVPREFIVPRGKVLAAGDTLVFHYALPTGDLPGLNSLFIEFNPEEDQPEMFHFNNLVLKEFTVVPDDYNPLIDVTFDGVHIMNRDIVSAEPKILVRLKDESRFLALTDTSLIKLQLRFPDEVTPRDYIPDGDTLRFIPADLSSNENAATLEFNPSFVRDGEYELIVSGKDMTGNEAGDMSYRVTFNVINKPMISHLLNYPNPFTTSTAFVFTVTGREAPQNIRIQIMTITGKVVREITSAELGPVHIGNNITEFKWDGTDMYGQKLANGVYLYRVLTNLNGKKLELFNGINGNGEVINDGVNGLDKYFNKGYGKMYLLR